MKTLRRRLTLTHTLVAVLAVLLAALLASSLIMRAYGQLARQQAQNTRLVLTARMAQYYTAHHGWSNVASDLGQRLETQPLPARRRVLLTDSNWTILFDSADKLEGMTAPPRFRLQSAPVSASKQVVGYIIVPAGFDDVSDDERAFGRAIVWIVGLGSVAAAGVALLVALLLARRLTTPLQSLTRAAQRLAAGERHQPLVVPRDAELAELAQSFNTMAAELDRQQALRKQLVADIAHELRTPLSVLRMQLEAVEDGVEQPTPALVASLSEEVGLLARLVEDLRLLSLADAGQLAFTIAPNDVRAALERAATAAAPRARQQGITLHIEAATLPLVLADGQRLAQILGNLIENALRYTPPGGTVTLGARRGSGIRSQGAGVGGQEPADNAPLIFSAQSSVMIEVRDTGPGIAPNDLARVFDRFYRADRARARETGGSGLGLAIVQRLVEAQGGQISVESALGQGTVFRVHLPSD